MISELIQKLFAARDCAHYAHWATTSGYHHGVLGDIYDQVVDYADRIMEAYIGNLVQYRLSKQPALHCLATKRF